MNRASVIDIIEFKDGGRMDTELNKINALKAKGYTSLNEAQEASEGL